MKEIILIGYSGHGYVVAEAALCSGVSLMYYCDKQEAISNPYGLRYLGYEEVENFIGWKGDYEFIIGVGNNKVRQKIASNIEKHGKSCISIIHPSALLANNVEVGNGTFIAANVTVNPLTRLGKNVILNTCSIIEHECIIDDGAHIAPGAVLAGNVSVGERTFVGANAVIKQGVNIGKDVVIGAGTVVLNNIEDGMKVVGNPGKII